MTGGREGHKSGFISIIGCPNAGKSTLLNALVGQKISIVSDKAQTTRNRISGVVTRKGYQMIFLDTPGVADPNNRLGEYMRGLVLAACNEVEAIVYVLDLAAGVGKRDRAMLAKLAAARAPKIAALNKADIAGAGKIGEAREWVGQAACFDAQCLISAKTGEGLQTLEEILTAYLTEGPQYYPEDMVTDQPERVICAELIREKALLLLRDEIPHGVGVEIEKMEPRQGEDLVDIHAVLYCEKETHKGILIGKQGRMLKEIGSKARLDMEWMLMARVNLQLFVKVRENWRNSPRALKELGYA